MQFSHCEILNQVVLINLHVTSHFNQQCVCVSRKLPEKTCVIVEVYNILQDACQHWKAGTYTLKSTGSDFLKSSFYFLSTPYVINKWKKYFRVVKSFTGMHTRPLKYVVFEKVYWIISPEFTLQYTSYVLPPFVSKAKYIALKYGKHCFMTKATSRNYQK